MTPWSTPYNFKKLFSRDFSEKKMKLSFNNTLGMVNCMCHLDWTVWYPDIWLDIILGASLTIVSRWDKYLSCETRTLWLLSPMCMSFLLAAEDLSRTEWSWWLFPSCLWSFPDFGLGWHWEHQLFCLSGHLIQSGTTPSVLLAPKHIHCEFVTFLLPLDHEPVSHLRMLSKEVLSLWWT